MDLTGSLGEAARTIYEPIYGSLGPGTGSSFIDAVLVLPVYLVEMVLGIAGLAGQDLGSTIPPAVPLT